MRRSCGCRYPSFAWAFAGYVSEFGKHVFTLRYMYNRDGQRDSLIHAGGAQTYHYTGGGAGGC